MTITQKRKELLFKLKQVEKISWVLSNIYPVLIAMIYIQTFTVIITAFTREALPVMISSVPLLIISVLFLILYYRGSKIAEQATKLRKEIYN